MALTYALVRRGTWVLHRGQIGIINTLNANNAEVHYVDERGETSRTDIVPLADLDMPTRDHIPASRLADIHPAWQPGQDIRYSDDYLQRHGLTAKQHATGAPAEPTGLSNLEFVSDDEFAKFRPEAQARVAHVRPPK